MNWLNTFSAQSKELKFAGILGLLTTIIVATVVLITLLSSPPVNTHHVTPHSDAVQIIDRPKLTSNTPTTATQPKPTTPTIKPQSKRKQNIVLGQGNYYVQVGAFTQKKLARLMLNKMKKHYQFAMIFPKTNTYAVWVGPVVSKKDALQLKKQIQRLDNIQGFITTKK